MAGSFDAKVDISTADAVANLRTLKAEVKEDTLAFREFNAALIESKGNVQQAAQQMTQLAAARRTNATATKEETQNTIAAARETAIRTQAEAKVEETLARKANQEAQAAKATEQGNLASERAAAAASKNAKANTDAAGSSKVLTDQLSNTRYLMYDVGASLGVLSAATLAIPAATASVAASYQKDFAQVLRVTEDLSNGGLDLRNNLKELATEIPMAFGDLTRITQLGAQLGIDNSLLTSFTETTAKFVAVTGVSADIGASLFGRMQTSFTAEAQQYPDFFNRMGSAIAYVGAKTVATDPEIASMLNQIGPLGASAGFTAEQITGLSAALASVRIQPELARGTLTRIFGNLNRDVSTNSPKLAEFGKLMDLTAQQAGALWKSDPSKFFTELVNGLGAIHDKGGDLTGALDKLGVTAVRDVSALTKLAVGHDVLTKSMDAAQKGFSDGTALDTMFKPINDTLISKLQKMSNAWQNLADTLGKSSLGPLGALVDALGSIATGVDHLIQQAPGLGTVISVLMGLVAVTGIFLGMKAAQAFVVAGLISFQQAAQNKGIVGAMSLSGVLKELAATFQVVAGKAEATGVAVAGSAAKMEAAAAATSASGVSVATSLGGKAVAGVKSFGSSLLGLAGGPIGIILIALTALIGAIVNSGAAAESAGQAIATGLGQGSTAGLTAAADELNKFKVSMGDTVAFSLWGKSMHEIADESGVSFAAVATAATKGKDAVAALTPELDRVSRSKGFKDFNDFYNNGGTDVAGLVVLRNKVRDMGDAAAKATTQTDSTKTALAAAGVQADTTGTALDDTAGALDTTSTAADKATKAIDDYVKGLFGIVDAQSATQDALSKLGQGLYKSLDMSTLTEGGRTNLKAYQDVIKSAALEQQQLVDSGQQSIQQASTNLGQFIDDLSNQLSQKGVNVDQIAGLAQQAKGIFAAQLNTGTDPTIKVKVDATQVNAAKTYLDSIVAVYGTTNLDVILKAGGGEQVAQNVSDMQTYIQSATGTPYTFVANADTTAANQGVTDTFTFASAVMGNPITMTVDSNTDPATQAIQALEQYAAGVVNQIIDGFNTVHSTVNGWFGQGAAPVGHVGWGEVAPPSHQAPAVAARPTIPAAPTKATPAGAAITSQNDANKAGLSGLADGYDKAGDAAEKAGKKGKQAGQDMANGIDAATAAAKDYSDRLKAGLTSAFDKQYGLQKATDDYHSALNAIVKKREDELKQVDDLTAKIKDLNNARDKDLIDANKAKIEANISTKYGEGDRAASYENTAQTALDNAAAKQKDIDASTKQRDTIQSGIGVLTGYSDAAIANRQALRDLESKTIDMIAAYAAQGHSIDQVRTFAQQLTAQFQTDVRQIYTNKTALADLAWQADRYIQVINAVPYTKPTTVTADVSGAKGAAADFNNAMDWATRDRTSKITVMGEVIADPAGKTTKDGQPLYIVTDPNTGQRMGDRYVFNRGGQVPGFASGGQIPGTPPSNPRADNLMAKVDGGGMIRVRSKEFIQPQEAVDFYGLDFMNSIRTMSLPKFNGGGSVGGYSGGGSNSGVTLVQLNSESLAALQRMGNNPIYLMTEDRVIAESASRGNVVLASQGHSS